MPISLLPPLHVPDCRFAIETFATKLGVDTVAWLGSGLLLLNYAGAIAAAIAIPHVSQPR